MTREQLDQYGHYFGIVDLFEGEYHQLEIYDSITSKHDVYLVMPEIKLLASFDTREDATEWTQNYFN